MKSVIAILRVLGVNHLQEYGEDNNRQLMSLFPATERTVPSGIARYPLVNLTTSVILDLSTNSAILASSFSGYRAV